MAGRLGHRRVGMAGAREDQAHVLAGLPDLGHGPHRGEGIEPGPEAASPQDDPVLGADARPHPFHPRACPDGGCIGQPVGDHVHQAAQGGIVLEDGPVDPAAGLQEAQPPVPLALAGADEEITPGVGHGQGLLDGRFISAQGQGLRHERVVAVDDQRDVALLEKGKPGQPEGRDEHRPGSLRFLAEGLAVGEGVAHKAERGLTIPGGPLRRGQDHGELPAQLLGQGGVADPGAGHAGPHHVVTDDQDVPVPFQDHSPCRVMRP